MEVIGMTLVPHRTDHVVTFWIPLPAPLGVPDGTELSLRSPGPFPEKSSGFFVPDHDEGPQYLAQSWLFFQETETATSRPLEFATKLFQRHLRTGLGIEAAEFDLSSMMSQIGTQWHTVVEVLCPLEERVEECIVSKLNEAIAALCNFQIGLSQLTGLPAHILTPRSVDPVPYLVSSFVDPENVLYGMTSPGNVTKYAGSVDIPIAKRHELEIVAANSLGASSAFRSSKVLQMEAQSARAAGAHILAAICLGAAAEARLTELCLFIGWEAEIDAETLSKATSGNGGVSNRCLQFLAGHLKGNWDRHQPGAIRDWDQLIVQLRNETAHGGYEPTVSDIDQAFTAYQDLGAYIRTRLLQRLKAFPYINSYYLGDEALRQSGHFELCRRIMDGYAITSDPEGSFFRYKAEVRSWGSSTGELAGGNVIQLVDANGTERWIELDETSMLCREVSRPPTDAWRRLQLIVGRNQKGRFAELLTDVSASATTPLNVWVPASTVIPTCSTRRSDQIEILEYQIEPR